MTRLEARAIKLEARGRNGWRAYASAGVPLEQWPDKALEGLLAESEGWPDDHVPSDEELRAIMMLAKDSTP